jgi:hypothetical protein
LKNKKKTEGAFEKHYACPDQKTMTVLLGPASTGTIALDPTFGSFTLLELVLCTLEEPVFSGESV